MSSALREAIYQSRDWQAQLASFGAHLKVHAEQTLEVAERAFDLATGFELAEPNRVAAVEMYLLCWKAAHAHPQALIRAQELCLELGELTTAAKISRLIFQQTDNADYLLAEGLAWIDAGEPDRALRVLMTTEKRMPNDQRVIDALATARQEWPDFRAEVARLERASQSAKTPQDAAERLLTAARILRMLGTEDSEYGRLLSRAFDAYPADEQVFSLFENWLVGQGDVDRLTQMYRRRSGSAQSEQQASELLRRAGTKLALRQVQVGLGMQLLRASVERAYQAQLREIPGHLATLVLLRRFSETAGSERDFLAVVAAGVATPISDDERVALAVMGLEVAWGRLKDPVLAHPYASILASLAPSHPSLGAYHAEGGMAHGQHLVAGAAAPGSKLNPCEPAIEEQDIITEYDAEEFAEGEVTTITPAAQAFDPDDLVEKSPARDPFDAETLIGQGRTVPPAPVPMAARAPAPTPIAQKPRPAHAYNDLPAAEPVVQVRPAPQKPANDGGISLGLSAPAPSPSKTPASLSPKAPAPRVEPVRVITKAPVANSVLGFELGPSGARFQVAPPSSPSVLDEDMELGPAGTAPSAPAPRNDDLDWASPDPLEQLTADTREIERKPAKKSEAAQPKPVSPQPEPATVESIESMELDSDELEMLTEMDEAAVTVAGETSLPDPGEALLSKQGDKISLVPPKPLPETASFILGGRPATSPPVAAEPVEPPPATRAPVPAESVAVRAPAPAKASPAAKAPTPAKAPAAAKAPAPAKAPVAAKPPEPTRAPVAAKPPEPARAPAESTPKDAVPVEQPITNTVRLGSPALSKLKLPGSSSGPNMGALIPKAALSALKTVAAKPEPPKPVPVPPGGKERAQRLPLPADVRIRCAGAAEELSMVTRDISETGMFILSGDTLDRLELGTAVELKISLPSMDDWSTTECELRGQVARHDAGRGTGINFENPPEEFRKRVRELIVTE